VTDLAERILASSGPVVQAGPFAGMTYPADRLADVDVPVAKLLGGYEHEIAWVFERAIAMNVSTFIDIGCADGYYAVGMAHASPTTTVYAYDLASSARALCAQTASASDVTDRVRIGRRFTVDLLDSLPAEGALVLCDIEGAEVELLDARAAAALVTSVVVVEAHDDERPDASAHLREAFARTHDAVTVSQRPRQVSPAAIAGWSLREQSRALREFRGPRLHWIVFRPKAG
jgi:precorrin-6B methylase 2